ncbi:MAG: PspC domain-containing protein [Anaerolineae bacterium]|jgi:phage shock protein PspC (stress-responsive transcriptional regulator)
MKSKLYRSRTDRMIAGICGGLGRYLSVDPTIIRLIFVLLALADGVGILIYFVMWLIVPPASRVEGATPEEVIRVGADEMAERARDMGDELRDVMRHPHPQTGVIIGAILIGLGVVFLLQSLHIPFLGWLKAAILWPVLLILAGVALLLRYVKGE